MDLSKADIERIEITYLPITFKNILSTKLIEIVTLSFVEGDNRHQIQSTHSTKAGKINALFEKKPQYLL